MDNPKSKSAEMKRADAAALSRKHASPLRPLGDDRLYGPQPVGPGRLPQSGKSHRNSRHIRLLHGHTVGAPTVRRSSTYPSVSHSIPPHSHSIILSDRNASNSECKFFPHMTKNRLADPSEICALEFKGEFAQFRNWLVSASPLWNHKQPSIAAGVSSEKRHKRTSERPPKVDLRTRDSLVCPILKGC
jgi:hypothetical protein